MYDFYMFEFDVNKSQSNKKNHGIDFVVAQKLWADPWYIEIYEQL
jgi:uncharacterized DUF497 family protein